jgi:hypothetical protein
MSSYLLFVYNTIPSNIGYTHLPELLTSFPLFQKRIGRIILLRMPFHPSTGFLPDFGRANAGFPFESPAETLQTGKSEYKCHFLYLHARTGKQLSGHFDLVLFQ